MDPLLKQILDPEALATLNRAIKAAPRPGASSDLQIAWLYEHHRALASEVVRLRAALAVVVEALQRTGTLDAERAVARMRELLVTGEEQTAVALTPVMDTPLMTPAKTAGPSAGQAGKTGQGGQGGKSGPKTDDSVFECQRCKKVIPALSSVVTSQGTFCAACYAEAPA